MKFSERELIQRITAGIEGDLSAEETAELDELLTGNPEARIIYLRTIQMHSLLEAIHPEANDVAIEEVVGCKKLIRFSRSRMATGLAVAAAVVILAIVTSFFTNQKVPTTIATLILAEDCEWKSSGDAPVEGQRLSPGRIHLTGGTAVIRFDNGAEMVMSTDSSVDLNSADSASLKTGEVIIRAEEGSEGFRLDSPRGEMTDLGTEFAVRVLSSGETELHVHEGEVAAGESVVTAGRAVKLLKSGNSDLPINAPRFSETIRKANPKERRDLMTAYEGFYTEAGVYSPEEMDLGKGWQGPWRLRTPEEFGENGDDTFSDMKIGFGKLNVVWPVRGGEKGMLELPPGRNIRLRQLSEAIDLSKDGITYFSFLAGEVADSGVSGEAVAPLPNIKRNDFRITLRSSEDYFGESLSAGWAKNRQVRVHTDPGAAFRSIRQIPEGETVFCVGKIIHSKRLSDQVQFRFYRSSDSLDFAEPAEWDIETRDLNLSANLDLLLITSVGQATRYVDEIRIGPTWRSVTPIDLEKLDD